MAAEVFIVWIRGATWLREADYGPQKGVLFAGNERQGIIPKSPRLTLLGN